MPLIGSPLLVAIISTLNKSSPAVKDCFILNPSGNCSNKSSNLFVGYTRLISVPIRFSKYARLLLGLHPNDRKKIPPSIHAYINFLKFILNPHFKSSLLLLAKLYHLQFIHSIVFLTKTAQKRSNF